MNAKRVLMFVLLLAPVVIPVGLAHAQETPSVSGGVQLSREQQGMICNAFIDENFIAMRDQFGVYGTTLEDSYDSVRCHDGRRDLIKYRMLTYSGRSDVAAFILHYKRDLNREQDLPVIFNRVVPGPGYPSGTLLDFIDFYRRMDDLNAAGQREYDAMINMLQKFGAKRACEVDPESIAAKMNPAPCAD